MSEDRIATSYHINMAACREANDRLADENKKLRTKLAAVEAIRMAMGEQDKEIERLRNIVEHAGVTIANLRKDKAATIERCAQVAEGCTAGGEAIAKGIAAAIRAMKD